MKCIKIHASKFGTEGKKMIVRRVNDDVAFDLVHRGPWLYATRTEWKIAGRKWGIGKNPTSYVPTRKEFAWRELKS